jgi:anti-anti-sigma regulatory factor/anti-sigma regulatory factor (Ser/Thr protein kinase)
VKHLLVCSLEHDPRAAVIGLDGVLDVASSATVRLAVLSCLADQPPAVVVDLAGLSIEDDIALTVFPALARTAGSWPGIELLLCAAPDAVAADLHRLAIPRQVPLCLTREQALRRAARCQPSRMVRLDLRPLPDACVAARRLVADACRDWGLPEAASRAEVVTTELVANAVRHAGTPITVTVSLRDRHLHLAVRDGTADLPVLRGPETPEALDGRGLIIVDGLSSAWGCIPNQGGKVVWATVRTRRDGQP